MDSVRLLTKRWIHIFHGALAAVAFLLASPSLADDLPDSILRTEITGLRRLAFGVTRKPTHLQAFWTEEFLADRESTNERRSRVLIVGGADGTAASAQAGLDSLRWFQSLAADHELRKALVIAGIPCVNPDELASGKALRFPPAGPAYNDKVSPSAAYLWRWIGMTAPDYVVELRSSAGENIVDASLVAQLEKLAANDMGTIPGVTLTLPNGGASGATNVLEKELRRFVSSGDSKRMSPARRTLLQRFARTPREVFAKLEPVYGHTLPKAEYIPAMAMVARLWVGEREVKPDVKAELEQIVAPYRDGKTSAIPTSGSGQSGNLIFTELAKTTTGERRARYIEIARGAADQMFDDSGTMKASMPFHSEMSDSLFMGAPILAAVGRLTADPKVPHDSKYFDACLTHLRFMRQLCLRSDGIYRHSPLDETAWGRGNGFPALGLSLSLSEFPATHPGRAELLGWYRDHMAAVAKLQDVTGAWHQVIDHEESYREFTSTCMITFAMLRGLRNGWLDRDTYGPIVAKSWNAIKVRISDEGGLVDVCTGTGKMKSLRDYYDRDAILGRDARGGAMAMLVTSEMELWLATRK